MPYEDFMKIVGDVISESKAEEQKQTINESKEQKQTNRIDESASKGGKLIFDYTVASEARKKCEENEFLSKNLNWREDGKNQEANFKCDKQLIVDELKKIGYDEGKRDFFISEPIDEASDQFTGLREVLADVEKQSGIVLDTDVDDNGEGEFWFDTNYNRNTFETEAEATEFENKYQEAFQKWCDENGYECNRSEDEDAPMSFWIRKKPINEESEEASDFEKMCKCLKELKFNVFCNEEKKFVEFDGTVSSADEEWVDAKGSMCLTDRNGTTMIDYVITFSSDDKVIDDSYGTTTIEDGIENVVKKIVIPDFKIDESKKEVDAYELEVLLNGIGKENGIENLVTMLELSDNAFLDGKHRECAYVLKFKGYDPEAFDEKGRETFETSIKEQITGWCENNGFAFKRPIESRLTTIIEKF